MNRRYSVILEWDPEGPGYVVDAVAITGVDEVWQEEEEGEAAGEGDHGRRLEERTDVRAA